VLVALFTVPFEDLCPLEQVVLFKDRYRLGTSGGRFWRVRGHEETESRYNQGEGNSLPMGGQRALEGDFYPLACNPCISGHNKRGNLPKFLR